MALIVAPLERGNDGFQKVSNTADLNPLEGNKIKKMLIASHNDFGTGPLSAFQNPVVRFIRQDIDLYRWFDNFRRFSNMLDRCLDKLIPPMKLFAQFPGHLRKNGDRCKDLHLTFQSKFPCLFRFSASGDESGNIDIRIEDDFLHLIAPQR